MSSFFFPSIRMKKGLKKLTGVLLKKFLFHVYDCFDKLKDEVKKKEKYKLEKIESNKIPNITFMNTNLEKAKKNIEKSIDLFLVVLNTLEGNGAALQQYVLENYTKDFVKKYRKEKSKKHVKKKHKKKFHLYEILYLSHLFENKNWSKNKEKEEFTKFNNAKDESMLSFQEAIKHIEQEITIDYKSENQIEYNPIFSDIDIIWKHEKKFIKHDFVNMLNNILTEFYLKKRLCKEKESNIHEEKSHLLHKNFMDKEKYTSVHRESSVNNKNLFFDYFYKSQKENKFDIIMKEANTNTFLQLFDFLIKDIEFIQSFQNSNETKIKNDSLDM